MSIVIDEVVGEITPAATTVSRPEPDTAETPPEDDRQQMLRRLKRYERRRQRLMAD